MTGWLLIDIIEVAPSLCPPPALPPPPTATDADGCMHGNYAIIASFVSSAFAFLQPPSLNHSRRSNSIEISAASLGYLDVV